MMILSFSMNSKPDVWQGTLALMVLKTLERTGSLHGYGIARQIEQTSANLLTVNYGTLYPALLKLEQEGYIASPKHYPAQLSGGQQQRVAVARALGGRPSILLADEPTGNLDSKNGDAVMALLRELHAEGATICLVTHDARYARDAQKTIHLFDGQVVKELGAAAP
jgi:ABC-type histidine transport system ATPase subunit